MLESALHNEGGWELKVKFPQILTLVMNADELAPQLAGLFTARKKVPAIAGLHPQSPRHFL
jgi:hypothetical protein